MNTLSVTTIQTDIIWQNVDENLQHFTKKINSIKEHSEIIILPEMFTTGFTNQVKEFAEDMNGKSLTWMAEMAHVKEAIITGSIIIKENEKYYNRLVWMQPNGKYHCYDKKHLFSLAKENDYFTAGNKKIIVQVKGWKICPLICYDLRFPVWSRQEKELQYDALLYVASWPKTRIVAWQTLLKARAIENQCFAIGVNRIGVDGNKLLYNGCTSISNPLGETLFENKNKEEITTTILHKKDIENTRHNIPFLNDGDDFIISK